MLKYTRLSRLSRAFRSSTAKEHTAIAIKWNPITVPLFSQYKISHARFSSTIVNFSENYSNDNIKELISSQDSDTFGTLSPNVQKADDEFNDEDDIEEERFLRNPKSKSQQLSTKQYADMIKEHLKYNRVKEAIDVLEVQIKEDGFRPMNYIFNLLIDGCARVGHTKKAFNLFTQMRQRGLRVTGATYTSLFNACANDPYRHEGLEKATRLREIMAEKGYEPNIPNYHAMIKAFGRCGDLPTAFVLVDEMIDKKLLVTTETFNFLLQACASEKEFGFRHALLVWHKMYQKGLKPDIYSFNLMLRCCRDTQMGDLASTKEVVQTIMLRNPDVKELEAGNEHGLVTPNLLALKPYLGNLVEMKQVKSPSDRFLLLGGLSGYLELMEQCDVTPNLKTFTELIEVIPNTKELDTKLLKILRKEKIRCDVDFFNVLIKRRALRNDYIGAREVIDDMIKRAKLQPDIVTYGVLALTCQSREEAWQLMDEMAQSGIKINLPILGGMLKQACYTKNFEYIMDLLYVIKQRNLKPNEKILEIVDKFIIGCNFLKKKDNKNIPRNFRQNVKKFKEDYVKWKEAVGLTKTEHTTDEDRKILKEKPYQQFKEPQTDGYEALKNEKLQRKQKLERQIKMIKTRPVLLDDVKK